MEQSASHIAGDPRAGSSPCSHSAAEIPCLAPQGTRPPRETQGQSQGLAAGWLSSLAAGHTIPARAPFSPVLPVHGQAREQMGRRPSSLAEGAPGPRTTVRAQCLLVLLVWGVEGSYAASEAGRDPRRFLAAAVPVIQPAEVAKQPADLQELRRRPGSLGCGRGWGDRLRQALAEAPQWGATSGCQAAQVVCRQGQQDGAVGGISEGYEEQVHRAAQPLQPRHQEHRQGSEHPDSAQTRCVATNTGCSCWRGATECCGSLGWLPAYTGGLGGLGFLYGHRCGSHGAVPEDDIIKRALLAARNPKEFMDGGAAVRLGQQAGQQPGWEQLGPAADAFSTPQRRRPLVPPHTPLLSQQAGRRQTETEPTSGAVTACATVTSQYGASSPAVMDPYVGSPLPVQPKPLRTSRSPVTRRSPHQKGPARTSVKEGARPTSVVRVAQERIQLGDVLHAKRQAAQQELQQQSISINQGPATVVSILDDDHDDHGRSIGTEVASLTTME